jgi:hypothetical protein
VAARVVCVFFAALCCCFFCSPPLSLSFAAAGAPPDMGVLVLTPPLPLRDRTHKYTHTQERLAAALGQEEEEKAEHAAVWEAVRRVQAASAELLVGVAGSQVPPTPVNTLRGLSLGGEGEGEGAREAVASAVVEGGLGDGGGSGGEGGGKAPERPVVAVVEGQGQGQQRRTTAAHAALSSLLDGDVGGGRVDGSGGGGGGGCGGGGGSRGGGGGLWGDASSLSSSSSGAGTMDPKLSQLLS